MSDIKKPTKDEWVAHGMSQDHTKLFEAVETEKVSAYLTEKPEYVFKEKDDERRSQHGTSTE